MQFYLNALNIQNSWQVYFAYCLSNIKSIVCILAWGSHSFACTPLITIIMQFYLNALNIQNSWQVYFAYCLSNIKSIVCILAWGSHSFACTPLITIIMQFYLNALNIQNSWQVYFAYCLSNIKSTPPSPPQPHWLFPLRTLDQLQTLVIIPCLCHLFWQRSSLNEQLWNIINFAWHDPS